MRAPYFWNVKSGPESAFMLRTLLLPFSIIYNYFTQRRIRTTTPTKLDAKVISIGNLTLGGTGKTPVARHIRAMLAKSAIVSRGYGGNAEEPMEVAFGKSSAQMVGDEPLMLAQDGAVFIGRDRVAAAGLAIKSGASTLILDDAHQNPSIQKDLSIIVVDGGVGFGNECVVPAGPLREKVEIGLARADAIIWIGDKTLVTDTIGNFDKPVIYAQLSPLTNALSGKYVGFCGIGRPEKFHETLEKLGGEIVDFVPFKDHNFYSEKELKDLVAIARHAKAKLITTEKDYIRLAPEYANQVEVLKIAIKFENEELLKNLIFGAIGAITKE